MLSKHGKSIVVAALAAALLAVFIAVGVTTDFKKPGDAPIGVVYEKARVTEIINDTIQPDPDYMGIRIGRQDVVLELLTGLNSGKTFQVINLVERIVNIPVKVGTKLVVASYDGFITASIVDYDRESTVYVLAGIFIAIVLILGRKKGLKSLLGLCFTIVCIVFLFIPLIVRGVEPILAAVVTVILATVVTLFLLGGVCEKTLAAGASCILCTLLAGFIAYVAGAASHISTLNTPEAESLLFVAQGNSLQIRHLLFAGILFSSLGAIMDTAMSIASSVEEIKAVDAKRTPKQLLRSGMNIGKDVMGTMTNTLILAFMGSSINLFVMFYMYSYPYTQLVNLQLLVVEIIQGLSGSIAVVLSIPVTALLAAFRVFAPRKAKL